MRGRTKKGGRLRRPVHAQLKGADGALQVAAFVEIADGVEEVRGLVVVEKGPRERRVGGRGAAAEPAGRGIHPAAVGRLVVAFDVEFAEDLDLALPQQRMQVAAVGVEAHDGDEFHGEGEESVQEAVRAGGYADASPVAGSSSRRRSIM